MSEDLERALREALQPFVDASVDGSGRLILHDPHARERARAALARVPARPNDRRAEELARVVRSGFESGMNHDAQEAALDELVARVPARGPAPEPDEDVPGALKQLRADALRRDDFAHDV